MSKRRDHEELGDVELSPDDSTRAEAAVAQADSERPPTPGSLHDIRMHGCGLSTPECRCECAHEPPPGVGPDWRPFCEHVWDGPWEEFREVSKTTGKEYVAGGTSTCSRCGMSSMNHDLWVLP